MLQCFFRGSDTIILDHWLGFDIALLAGMSIPHESQWTDTVIIGGFSNGIDMANALCIRCTCIGTADARVFGADKGRATGLAFR